MKQEEIISTLFADSDRIVKTEEFISLGLTNQDVAVLCNEGFIKRLQHGYYQLAGKEEPRDEILLSYFFPDAILCMNSALFHYGYSDFTPRVWSIAVPRTFSRSRLKTENLSLQPYFIQPNQFDIGKTEDIFNGVSLSVYDRERTICDCFKYESKMDSEIFGKALKFYVKDSQKNLSNLFDYAKRIHVYNKMIHVMEVLLNE